MVNGYISIELPVNAIIEAGNDGLELENGSKIFNDIVKADKPVVVKSDGALPYFPVVSLSEDNDTLLFFLAVTVDATNGVSQLIISLTDEGVATASTLTYVVAGE